jgi:hypothetical protein
VRARSRRLVGSEFFGVGLGCLRVWAYTLAVIAEVSSISLTIGVKSHVVDTFGAGPRPDLWFGLGPHCLHPLFFDRLGNESREAYLAVADETFPPSVHDFMHGPAEVPGEGIGYVIPVVLFYVFVETFILKCACDLFPERLDNMRVVARIWRRNM